MKSLTFVLLCIHCLCALAYLKEKQREMAVHLLSECRVTEGGSDDDLKKLIREEYPETKEGNCMMACAYEIVGIVSKKFHRSS